MTTFFHHKISTITESQQYIHAGLGKVTWLLGFEDVTVVVHLEQRAVLLQTREHLLNNALLGDVIDLARSSCSTSTSTHHRIDPRVLHVHAAPRVRVHDQAEALVVPNVVAAQLSVQVVVLALQSQQ